MTSAPQVLHFEPGNYSFLAVPRGPFSAGVVAMTGYALHRAKFHRPVPMSEGYSRIELHLKRLGRPMTALAACELRSPAPMTPTDFAAFNGEYLKPLHGWGCKAGDFNPVARSNIAPITEVPQSSTFFAFTYTVPEQGGATGELRHIGQTRIPRLRNWTGPDLRRTGHLSRGHRRQGRVRDGCDARAGCCVGM